VKKKKNKIVKVYVCIPNEGKTESESYDNRLIGTYHLGSLQILSHFGVKEFDGVKFDYPDGIEFKFYHGTIGRTLTPIARERLAEHALEFGADYLLFIDDDMICPSDLFERLYKHQKDIVGALAFTRYAPHKPVIFNLTEGYDKVEKKEYFISTIYYNYPKDTLVECDAVGFGAVLINCKVFKEMKQPWFVMNTGAGEDVQFCFDAKKAGFKVYMDTATKLGHLSTPVEINEDTYESETNVNELRKTHGDKPTFGPVMKNKIKEK
jgi:GT2 family glycosyltransferase